MIQVNRITKTFNKQCAVADLTLSLPQGEVVGMLGLNGAGKSTTLRMLSGYIPPDHGEILINGVSLMSNPQLAQADIGYLPEGAPSYRDLTVWQMLNFLAGVRGLSEQQTHTRINYVCQALALTDVLLKQIETLSKGFKRRVGLAQALLHDPKVLLLDEPTDGLDPQQKQEVRSLIRKLAKPCHNQHGASDKTIVISTHHFDDIEALCDRILVIHQGRLICDVTPEKMKQFANEFSGDKASSYPLAEVFNHLISEHTPEAPWS